MPVTLFAGNLSLQTLAFLDEGSSSTLVDEVVAKRLKLTGELEPLIVTWTGGIKRHENCSRKIRFMLSANGCEKQFTLDDARTMSELMLPKQCVRFSEITARYPHLSDLPVADHSLEDPKILLGLNNLHLFAPLESRVGNPGEPLASRWTVYGPEIHRSTTETFVNLHSIKPASNQELHEVGVTSFGVPESAEDQRARTILQETTVRIGDRFQTGLLWREDVRQFPDSFPMAFRRLKALERKLEKNSLLKENVLMQIEEYQAKGYAHKATTEEIAEIPSSNVWYLPLNVVLNPRKPDKIV